MGGGINFHTKRNWFHYDYAALCRILLQQPEGFGGRRRMGGGGGGGGSGQFSHKAKLVSL